jgi:hypothetical protein
MAFGLKTGNNTGMHDRRRGLENAACAGTLTE